MGSCASIQGSQFRHEALGNSLEGSEMGTGSSCPSRHLIPPLDLTKITPSENTRWIYVNMKNKSQSSSDFLRGKEMWRFGLKDGPKTLSWYGKGARGRRWAKWVRRKRRRLGHQN
eukprot:TRINITY_DN89_c0_g1_i1.p1 TRINITY_DN89_c0_g1~~TRINITY_DN89_c0_g1_i1.p1  ORF type:complete len:115 (-),score=16.90 TRINITY_DN89_c0_g1_i1:1175-1519(-)